MPKQTKQLIVLVIALVVLGGVAFYVLVLDKDTPASGTAKTKTAKQGDTPAQPAGTAKDAKGGPAGSAPVVQVKDEDIPPEATPRISALTWPVAAPLGAGFGIHEAQREGIEMPWDPLKVKNVDIVNPQLKEEIERLKAEWVPDGISVLPQPVRKVTIVTREDGTRERTEEMVVQDVVEVWFAGQRSPYKVDDRLVGTRYVIQQVLFGDKIWESSVEIQDDGSEVRQLTQRVYDGPDAGTQKAVIRLRGDKGNLIDMELAPASRYGDAPGARRPR